MVKTVPTYLLPEKKNSFKILVDKIRSPASGKTINQDPRLKKGKYSEKSAKYFATDPQRWNKFQNRYSDEFHGKIRLMEEIRQRKIEKKPLTWIYAPRYGYNKAIVN
jgi:uncharacterized protein YeaO (DUF488 family)